MTKPFEGASDTVREIHRRMVAAGLTPTTLALAVGARPTYFHDLFAGKSLRPTLHLVEVARVFKCTVEELTDPRASKRAPRIPSNTDEMEEAALLSFWRMLSRTGRRRVMRAIIAEARSIVAERSTKAEP